MTKTWRTIWSILVLDKGYMTKLFIRSISSFDMFLQISCCIFIPELQMVGCLLDDGISRLLLLCCVYLTVLKYTEQQKKCSYLIWNQNIRNLLQCVIVVFWYHFLKILPFKLPLRVHQKCVPLNLKVTRYVRTFRPTIRTIISSAHNEKSNIAFAVGSWHVFGYEMWLKVWYWNKIFVLSCPLWDNVFRTEERLK